MTVNKSSNTFGFPSSVYKAWSNKDGKPYVLRRIEGKGPNAVTEYRGWRIYLGFRLANEKHIMNVQRWKKILSGSVVTVHDAFTTTRFGDSCKVTLVCLILAELTVCESYHLRIWLPSLREDPSWRTFWGPVIETSESKKQPTSPDHGSTNLELYGSNRNCAQNDTYCGIGCQTDRCHKDPHHWQGKVLLLSQAPARHWPL